MTVSSKIQGAEVLNLCFHGIGQPGRPLEPDEENFWITRQQFDELIPVIGKYPATRITFDDGNASDAAVALPALREHGLTATFFVIADRLDQPGSLTSADVRRLVDGGMKIGSHGKAHRPWRSIDDAALRGELVDAAKAIAAVSGQPVGEVACPFGDYDRRVLTAIRRCGFDRVYTVDGGTARSNAWLQSRYTIRADDTLADIERRLRSPRSGAVESVVRRGKAMVKRWR